MKNLKLILPIALILIITFLAFLPCLKNNFVNFDDTTYITELTIIAPLSFQSIKHIFTSFFLTGYQPLSRLSFLFDYNFFKLNPFMYHLTNLILHLSNCLLVFWLIHSLTRRISLSSITAILFAIHPVHVEPVAWISARQDLLCAFFFLATLICYCYYLRDKQINKYYYLSIVLFIFSLLSKAIAVTLPLVLIFIDYLFYRKPDKRMFLDKISFFLLSFIFGVVAIIGKYSIGAVKSENLFTFSGKAAVAVYSIAFYIKKILFPVKLSCFYPYSGPNSISLSLYSVFIFIVLFILVIISIRYTRKVVFGSMFFLITILPVLQFIPINITIVADRYLYISSIGLFFIAACVFVWLCTKKAKTVLWLRSFLSGLLIIVICILGFLTWKRCQVWNNSITLWNDVLKNYPNVDLAYHSLGIAYADSGDYSQAISNYNRAIELNPNVALAYNNRGVAYAAKGDYDNAISDYTKAIERNPNYAETYSNRGTVYADKDNYDQAISDFTKAIELNHSLAEAYYNRGLTYANRGIDDQAIVDYSRAIEINPNFAYAYITRGAAYLAREDYDRAWEDAHKAQALGKVDPEFIEKLKKASGREK